MATSAKYGISYNAIICSHVVGAAGSKGSAVHISHRDVHCDGSHARVLHALEGCAMVSLKS